MHVRSLADLYDERMASAMGWPMMFAHRRTVDRIRESAHPLQRTLIVLAYYGGYTYADVAARLGTPLTTGKSHIRDGLEGLSVYLPESELR